MCQMTEAKYRCVSVSSWPLALALFAQRALAEETFIVAPQTVADEKAVFATVESANIVPARARIGGTVVQLAVRRGRSTSRKARWWRLSATRSSRCSSSRSMRRSPAFKRSLTRRKTDLAREQELFAQRNGRESGARSRRGRPSMSPPTR